VKTEKGENREQGVGKDDNKKQGHSTWGLQACGWEREGGREGGGGLQWVEQGLCVRK
jgi:hypothetical protein